MTTLPQLPTAYLAFLEQHNGDTYYLFNDIDGWRFYTVEELTEVIRVNRDKVQAILQLSAYVSSIRKHIGDETEDQDGEPYSLDRLAAGLAIGDNNGDVVFLDPTDEYSVWIWYHDGADVERLVDSFARWLEMAALSEDEDKRDQAPHPPAPSPRSEEKGRRGEGLVWFALLLAARRRG
jgi:hypothetical protein